MKHAITIIMIICASIAATVSTTISAIQQPTPVEIPPKPYNLPQPPADATIISDLKDISFELLLDTEIISLETAQSSVIEVIIGSTERVELDLAITSAQILEPRCAELPLGITAFFNPSEIVVEENSSVAVELTLSLGNKAAPGIYDLAIFAYHRTSYGGTVVSVPLRLTVQ